VVYPILAHRGAVDLEHLRTYCQVWARWREAEDGIEKAGQLARTPQGRVVPSPLVAIANQNAATVRALEERLGFTFEDGPSANGKVAGPLVTRRELAALLGVHMQTVTKWEQDGMPIAERGSKGRPSRYRELDVRAWKDAREDAAKKSGLVDVSQERARKERAQAILAEQTFQIRQRGLLPRDAIIKEGQAYTKAWSAKVRSWPRRARQLGIITTPEQEAALTELARELLTEIARWKTLADSVEHDPVGEDPAA
jgi:P27 family predicted phage terminase small subunit